MSLIAMEGELCISQIAMQRDALWAAWPASQPDCTLNLSRVEGCDSSGVQLLIAARRSAQARGGRCTLVEVSQAVQQALQNYGFGDAWCAETTERQHDA